MGLDQATIEGLRAMIRAGGVQRLAVGDLRAGEVAELAWSGNPAHLRSVAAAVQRAAQGLEDSTSRRSPASPPSGRSTGWQQSAQALGSWSRSVVTAVAR